MARCHRTVAVHAINPGLLKQKFDPINDFSPIAFVCSYEGFITEAGAEGVGKSTAKAVVITSVTILILDTLTAALLAPYLQT